MFNIFPIGCDSTSSFYGKGKKTAWDTLLRNREYFNSFRSLGNAFPPSEELVLQLNRFVCLLYADKNSENVNKCSAQMCADVVDVRMQMWMSKMNRRKRNSKILMR